MYIYTYSIYVFICVWMCVHFVYMCVCICVCNARVYIPKYLIKSLTPSSFPMTSINSVNIKYCNTIHEYCKGHS